MIASGATIGVLAAQVLSAYVISAWLGAAYDDPTKHSVSAFGMVAAVLAAYGLPRLLAGFDMPPRARAAAAAVITVLAIHGILRLEFAGDLELWNFGWLFDFLADAGDTAKAGSDAIGGGLFVIGAWAWGLWRSQQDVELEFVPRGLAGPFGMVTFGVIIAAPTDAIGEVGRGAAAFYALSIVVLALAQLARSGATIGTVRAGGVTAALLAGTASLTVVGVILFGLIWGPFSGPVGSALATVIQVVLTIALTPIAWVLERLMDLIFSGTGLGSFDIEPATIAEEAAEPGEEKDPSTASVVSGFVFRLLALAIVLGAVALGLAVLTRMRKRRAAPALSQSAPVRSGSFAEDIRSFAAGLIPHWRRGPSGPTDSDAVRLYVEVLREAEGRGRPRAPARTPDEFAPELAATFASSVTDEITLAFEEARYAGRSPDPALIRELQRRWRQRPQPQPEP